MQSLGENMTFELVKLPKGKRALKNRWVYQIKKDECTSQGRYNTRLVVKGFKQWEGVDFGEIFPSVVKMQYILVVLGLAASLDLEVDQMDVKTTFLHWSTWINLHGATRWIPRERQKRLCLQIGKKSLWFETSTSPMVSKVQLGDDWTWVQDD